MFGVSINLLILGFFKYNNLIIKSFDLSGSPAEYLIAIPLPIGISFFTFQGISLLMDVYKGEYNSDRNLKVHSVNTSLFISFFSQLIAGPILKASEFMPQIQRKSLKEIKVEQCFHHLVIGYFLKIVVADHLKNHTFWIAYPYFLNYSANDLIVMLFGYSMQIFADFAGYSLIAIGTAGLFGYSLRANFNFPYISKSFSEFWTRWHISLSSFLKEYLYIPLGGNRHGKIRTYSNLMIVMALGGLWHGAAWSYMVWGIYHGLALILERVINPLTVKFTKSSHLSALRVIIVFMIVTVGWLLFKLPEFKQVLLYLQAVKTNPVTFNRVELSFYTLLYSLPVVAYHIHYLVKNSSSTYPNYLLSLLLRPLIYAILLMLILTNSGTPGEFIYFQF